MGGCLSRPHAEDSLPTQASGQHSKYTTPEKSSVRLNQAGAEGKEVSHTPAQRSKSREGSEHGAVRAARSRDNSEHGSSKVKPEQPVDGVHLPGEKENPEFLPGSRPGSNDWDRNNQPLDLSEITGRSTADDDDVAAKDSLKKMLQEVRSSDNGRVAAVAGDGSMGMGFGPRGGNPMFAQMNSSTHGGGAGAFAGATSMHGGVAAMGSSSMHAGFMASGSMHGGGTGRASAVAMRAMQAAKLRASKTALERHNVQIVGTGSELLVLSHGFGQNKNIWSSIVGQLDTSVYRIVLYDLTGALGTDYDAFDYQRYSTLHGFAEDLLQLLGELGVEGTDWGHQCTFIGHQQSGMMGLLASLERPRVFKRIIIMGSSPRLLDAPGYEGGFALNDLDQVFGIMQGNFKMWSRGCAPVLTADDVKAPLVRDFTRPLFLLRPDIGFSNLKTAFACDVRDILPRVSVQIHLLFFDQDSTVPQSVIQYMLTTIPNAFAEILATTGFADSPTTVAAGIQRHLSMPIRETFGLSSRRIFNARYLPPPMPEMEEDAQEMEVEII
ncbi:unnamed protein product [Closterium sp. Yama58-4]|nr:unnamed protein product [Closterium sp. Yama58-4]